MQLGELLVTSGILTQGQLEEALRKQGGTRQRLGEILIEMNFITEKVLAEVLEFQLGFPFVHLYNTEVDPQCVKLLPEDAARKYGAIPIGMVKNKLQIVMIEPLNFSVIEQIQLITGKEIQPMIGLRSEIEQALNKYYRMPGDFDDWIEETAGSGSPQQDDEDAANSDAPIIKLVNQMIHSAVNLKASDIHIEPDEKDVKIRYRIDGQLRVEMELPKHMQALLTTRVKILSKLNIAERRLPQDGNIQLQITGKRVDIRVSTLPSVNGESIVLRLLDQSAGIKGLDELGFNDGNLQIFKKMSRRPNGIILISGPTGSGKTSTLYSILREMKNEDIKIITVEDPVEYRFGGITQVQVNTQIGMTFASSLRSILRQDPNVVMVGEIRDPETASIAVRASLTGHLVLSTIHTNNALSTVNRLLDMGIEGYLIASSLACVTAQRLVRKLCVNCAELKPATEEEKVLLLSHKLLDHRQAEELKLLRACGCGVCGQTGYYGRVGIHEVLMIDADVRTYIMEQRAMGEFEELLAGKSFRTMLSDGLQKVLGGITDVQEVLKAAFSE
jgi:type IV pilus assembly protein PilB